MSIKRTAFEKLKQKIAPNKVVMIYGPRRVGKTTLMKKFISEYPHPTDIKFVSGESVVIQKELSVQTVEGLKSFLEGKKILMIDEAQYVPNIGINLKIIVDHIPGVSIIASGSSSFDLTKQVGEPLVGRKTTLFVHPISAKEIILTYDRQFYLENLEKFLVYGTYPHLFSLPSEAERKEYLNDILHSYLLKDILEFEGVINAKKIRDLITLLSFQIGKEVSLSELGRALEMNSKTVARYLDLLEKAFILINIRGFSRNLRSEVTKTSRYYFYDNGIRNALINNFNSLSLRSDVGQLWENYIVLERLKKQTADDIFANNYFWRTYTQQEVDWVEERDGKQYGFEIKWGDKKIHAPRLWLDTYPEANFEAVTKENFLDFIT